MTPGTPGDAIGGFLVRAATAGPASPVFAAIAPAAVRMASPAR